jgi:hypothetical protein
MRTVALIALLVPLAGCGGSSGDPAPDVSLAMIHDENASGVQSPFVGAWVGHPSFSTAYERYLSLVEGKDEEAIRHMKAKVEQRLTLDADGSCVVMSDLSDNPQEYFGTWELSADGAGLLVEYADPTLVFQETGKPLMYKLELEIIEDGAALYESAYNADLVGEHGTRFTRASK